MHGERYPWNLAALRDVRVQATKEEIAYSLGGEFAGGWSDVLFELKQVLANCDFLQQQITDCDVKLEKEMRARPTRPSQPEVGAAAAPLEMRPVGSSVWSGRLMNRDE